MKLSYSDVRSRCLKPNMAEKPWYGKTISHFFSTRIVWILSDFSIHPDYFTALSLAIGLCSAAFFWNLTPGSVFAGALLLELYYVFDAVDGQWARLKKLQTKTGAFFDSIVTYAVQPALYFSIGWGLYNATGDAAFIAIGAVASFAALWATLLWHFRATVLLYFIQRSDGVKVRRKIVPSAATPPPRVQEPGPAGVAKTLFTFLQRSITFPLTLNFLTLISLASFLASILAVPFPTAGAFQFYLLWTAAAGGLISVVMTASWILRKKIDHDWNDIFNQSLNV